MTKCHPKIAIIARDAGGEVVQQLEYSPEEWYDGAVPPIDEDILSQARLRA